MREARLRLLPPIAGRDAADGNLLSVHRLGRTWLGLPAPARARVPTLDGIDCRCADTGNGRAAWHWAARMRWAARSE